MFTYSTCTDCGGLLMVTDGDTAHPACTPHHTAVEYLTEQWLAAVLADDPGEADRLQGLIDAHDARPPRLADAAGIYASWGWPVFPLKAGCGPGGCWRCKGSTPCGKRPATLHGFKQATTDPDRIHAWWKRHPDHNIGLATGHRFDVIDIDGMGDGTHTVPGAIAYSQLLEQINPTTGEHVDEPLIPDTHGQVSTATGGLHLYIEPTGRGNRAKIYPGIDYRGLGGYVVAPPSTLGVPHRAWAWIVKPSPVLTGQAARR